MKKGDLVKMKYTSHPHLRAASWLAAASYSQEYIREPLLVYQSAYNAVKVILPNGQIKTDLKEHYEIVQKS